MQAIKLSEEPKRREWPFFTLMDVYFSDQVNDPSLRLFSSTKRFDTDTFDDKNFDEELQAVLAAANINASMSSVLSNLGLGIGLGNRMNCLKRDSVMPPSNPANMVDFDVIEDKQDEDDDTKPEVSINLSTKLLSNLNSNHTNDKNNNKSHLPSLNNTNNKSLNESLGEKDHMLEPNNNTMNNNRNLMGSNSNFSANSEASLRSSTNSTNSHPNNNNDEDYEDNMVRAYERNLKNLNQKFLHEMNEHHNIDQYLLSWRGFHGNMCKGFHTLQRDGQMVDVTIAAGGKIFKAHKLVSDRKFLNLRAFFSLIPSVVHITGSVSVQPVLSKDFHRASVNTSNPVYDRCQ